MDCDCAIDCERCEDCGSPECNCDCFFIELEEADGKGDTIDIGW